MARSDGLGADGIRYGARPKQYADGFACNDFSNMQHGDWTGAGHDGSGTSGYVLVGLEHDYGEPDCDWRWISGDAAVGDDAVDGESGGGIDVHGAGGSGMLRSGNSGADVPIPERVDE